MTSCVNVTFSCVTMCAKFLSTILDRRGVSKQLAGRGIKLKLEYKVGNEGSLERRSWRTLLERRVSHEKDPPLRCTHEPWI